MTKSYCDKLPKTLKGEGDIDLPEGLISVTMETNKKGQDKIIPLTALEILKQRQ